MGSPSHLLPTARRTVLIHEDADTIVPISQSREYSQNAQQQGDCSSLEIVQGVGHFDMVHPKSAAWQEVKRQLSVLMQGR
jgi:pimeloyl-ACP methyl ester carboxylesterase